MGAGKTMPEQLSGNQTNSDALHTRHSRVIIDLNAIRANYTYLKSTCPQSKVIAVIKADAYGHGAIQVAQALPHADAFAVATTLEAIPLRKAGVTQKIIILGGVINEAEMRHCIDYRLDPVIHQNFQIELLSHSKLTGPLDVWLKFNSGMGRLGFNAEDLVMELKRLGDNQPEINIRLMTHLANADDPEDKKSLEQIDQVNQLALAEYEWGISNSAGILGWPQSHKHWVRCGIALYGSDPMNGEDDNPRLTPVMTFKSQILAVNQCCKGQSIGYGGLFTCEKNETIAVVAAGYADGYPRHLIGGFVSVNGERAEIVGRVSMDMITIKVTGMSVAVGDEVILWGSAPTANEIARCSETISYELFCHAGCHGKREYINQ